MLRSSWNETHPAERCPWVASNLVGEERLEERKKRIVDCDPNVDLILALVPNDPYPYILTLAGSKIQYNHGGPIPNRGAPETGITSKTSAAIKVEIICKLFLIACLQLLHN